jgi:hypothetical protein
MHAVMCVLAMASLMQCTAHLACRYGCCMQREARERVKELSKRIGAANATRLAPTSPAKPRAKELSARQRAVEYAKASVPKPELLKQRSSGVKRGSSAPAAAGGRSSSGRQQVGVPHQCLRSGLHLHAC